MPDQELTALKIRIEAEVASALKQLDSLAAKVVVVENQVRQSVSRINASLKSFEKTAVNVNLKVTGEERVKALEKKIKELQATASDGVQTATPNIPGGRRQSSVVPSESEISSFVSAVKSGVSISLNEIERFRDAVKTVFKRQELVLGVDNTQVLALKKDLEFLNGYISASKREIKFRVSTEGDAELRNKLNNINKEYVLSIVPSFDDANFNKLLTDIQNKRINLTFDDVSKSIKEEIDKLDNTTANLPVGADTSLYDSRIAQLKNTLTKVQAIQVDANTAPAETALQKIDRLVNQTITKGPKLKIDAVINTPNTELNKLYLLKRRIESEIIKIQGKFDTSQLEAQFEFVENQIEDLNRQGVNLVGKSASLYTAQSVADSKQIVKDAKEFKAIMGTPVNVRTNGITEIGRQANQVGRAFEQIVRDAPSFAYSTQAGLIAISNNIGPLQDSFVRLAQEAKRSGDSMGKALLGTVSGMNGVLLAISIGVTLLTVFAGKLFGASKEADKLKEKFKEIKEIIDNTRFVVPQAIGSIKGDVQRVRVEAEFVANANNDLEERARILKRLQEISPQAFGQIKLETTDLTELLTAVALYEDLSKNTEAQNARVSDLNKKEGELALIKEKQAQAQERLNAAAAAFKPIESRDEEGRLVSIETDFTKTGEFKRLTAGVKIFDAEISNLQENIKGVRGEISANAGNPILETAKDLKDGSSKINDIIKERLQSQQALLQAQLGNLKQFNKDYNEQFSALQKQAGAASELGLESKILALELQIKLVGVTDRETRENIIGEIDELRSGVETEYSKQRLSIGIATIDFTNIQKEIDKQRDLIRERGVTGRDDISGPKPDIELPKSVFEFQFNSIAAQINGFRAMLGEDVVPVDFWLSLMPDPALYASAAEAQKAWLDKMNENLAAFGGKAKEAFDYVKQFKEQVAQILASGTAELFGEIFEKANAGLLTFKTLGEAVSNFAQDIIKAIVKLLIMQQILKALNVSTPAGGAAGGGFDLLSFLFRGFKPRKFATGGLVTGPTFGMVGEAGPEAVLPLSYLNNLMSSVGGSANLQARVSGQDLLFVMERAGRVNNRTF
jgi:hypothetical protein